MKPFWNIGENGAHKRLTEFLDNGIANYKNGRNFPAKPFVSKISPHIHFGEISPNHAWYAAKIKGNDASIDHFRGIL
jgi:Deoxyribodipyrimidine photolyase